MPVEATDTRQKVLRQLCRAAILAGQAAIVLAVIGTVCTYAGIGPWYVEGTAYWVPCYLFLSAAGTFVGLVFRAYRSACAGAVCVCAVAILVAPLYLESPNRAQASAVPNLRIVQSNVYDHNGDPEALEKLIRDASPGVVLLEEVDTEWERRLSALESVFPEKAFLPRPNGRRCDLGQYLRVKSDAPRSIEAEGIPGVLTRLCVNGVTVSLVHVHLASPFSPDRAIRHHEQMRALTQFVKTLAKPVIVAGDLNSGPWSPLCRVFLRETGLVSVRQGLGMLGTWPSFLGPLGVGIDQMFVSAGIEVVATRVGPGIGSDHRPLITDLCVSPEATARATPPRPSRDRTARNDRRTDGREAAP